MADDLILSIDTSDRALGLEICTGGEARARRIVDEPKVHAAQLVPAVLNLLEELNLSFLDVAAVAVAKGPGSYTGLRIGVSSAKGLAYALGIPLMGIPTMRAMAVAHGTDGAADALITCLSSRKNEVFLQVWDMGESIAALSEVCSVALDDVHDLLGESGRQRFVVCGSGSTQLQAALDAAGRLTVTTSPFDDPAITVRGVSIVAAERFVRRDFDDVTTFEPFYLKDFVARKGRSPFAAARNR